jgi:hypothetical protein
MAREQVRKDQGASQEPAFGARDSSRRNRAFIKQLRNKFRAPICDWFKATMHGFGAKGASQEPACICYEMVPRVLRQRSVPW